MYGSSWISFISSRSDGRIFLILRPSENLSRTLVNPFMKEIFSSRDFAANVDRSKKLRVDIGNDEKNECDGSVAGDGRLCECRVMSESSKTVVEDISSFQVY